MLSHDPDGNAGLPKFGPHWFGVSSTESVSVQVGTRASPQMWERLR